MAASLNKVVLIANTGTAVDLREAGDSKVASFSVATSKRWRDRETQERMERTEWHRVEVWGGLADVVHKYGRKGGLVYVEGSLRTDRFTDKNGVERFVTKVRAGEVKFLDHEDRKGSGASENCVSLIGHFGAAPEVRAAGDGSVASFSLATTERWADRKGGGERREHTEWHRIEAWDALAKVVGEIGAKGRLAYVVGELITEKFTGSDGVERYTTKVRASQIKFLDRAPRAEDGERAGTGRDRGDSDDTSGGYGFDDDAPFMGDVEQEPARAASAPAPRAAAPAAAPASAPAPRRAYDPNRFRRVKEDASA